MNIKTATTQELLEFYRRHTGSDLISFKSRKVAEEICERITKWPGFGNTAAPQTRKVHHGKATTPVVPSDPPSKAKNFKELCQEMGVSPGAARRKLRVKGLKAPYTDLDKIREALR